MIIGKCKHKWSDFWKWGIRFLLGDFFFFITKEGCPSTEVPEQSMVALQR